ncbi:hypothetical protein L596_025692 [Steinernema carpocapsae]|uniref:ISXO2-like transposase domain-containing protein n=1 Tax=Steinernema carpocapsae TaxID=34508 RepID=A0A4V6XVS3_STECR|nr:hypothetical protein L596_025692 [Steinernema carpocapsae]
MLGGPGKVVKIDETCLSRQKKSHKANVDFGYGRHHEDAHGTLPNSSRNEEISPNGCCASPLLPMLQRHCRPGTTIISDKWSAYGGTSSFFGRYDRSVCLKSLEMTCACLHLSGACLEAAVCVY